MNPKIRALLPPYARPGSYSLFGFNLYGHHSEKWWFRCTIGACHTALRWFDTIYYWIAWRTFDRYHVVKTDLKPGYYDVDSIMFHACFRLLGEYVEKELGKVTISHLESLSQSYDGHYRGYRLHSTDESDKKSIDLWLWYRHELVELRRQENDDWRSFTNAYGHYYLDNLEQEKLEELIKIRQCLWT